MEKITKLAPNQVFVFGSNLAGKHGRGAAKQALKWGARYGKGEGLCGQTYGIPTKDRNLNVLSLEQIAKHINRFIKFAKQHPNLEFLVTEIGCGLAGYKPKDIAPLFRKALKVHNIKLPDRFIEILMVCPYCDILLVQHNNGPQWYCPQCGHRNYLLYGCTDEVI